MDQRKVNYTIILFIFLRLILQLKCEEIIDLRFPDGFSIGVGTSSYQIEGGWNISDKGESLWDRYVHEHPDKIDDGSTGDITSDSYHKYKEDVMHIKELGFNHYRFSLSWGRILPTGYDNVVSKDGIKYYHNLLNELETNGIEAFVTIYHWDHPEALQKLGGWTNEVMVDLFGDYARVVFREFGDRVKFFTTINEPIAICRDGYTTGILAPGYKLGKSAEYLCAHNLLKAHARAYHIYNDEFRAKQRGKIGLTIPCFYPIKTSDDEEHVALRELYFQFYCGLYANPIFSDKGDYPESVKERVAVISKLEGRARSKLPTFSKYWIDYIKGTYDYFGLNHYSSWIVEPAPKNEIHLEENDEGAIVKNDETCPGTGSSWLKIIPKGLREVLIQIKKRYNNPPIYILENGVSDNGTNSDIHRIEYFHSYMREMLIAMKKDNCDVRGYTVWSLLDNFEWNHGYSENFGILRVDFNHSNRTRSYKQSTKWIKDVLHRRQLIENYSNYTNI